MTDVIEEIAAERRRQVEAEGWSSEHDDEHDNAQLAAAAATYITEDIRNWPWEMEWWKPTTARRNYVKAAALLVAEIERLDRVAGRAE